MKKVGVVLGLLGVAALVCVVAYVGINQATTSAIEMSPEEVIFHYFKRTHRKFYFNDDEHNFRFNVWKANRAQIMQHNANPERSYNMEINMFSDLTTEEFLAYYTGANYQELMPEEEEEHTVYFDEEVELESTTIDWSKKGVVTGVKNQGHCGSCWAFSATGALEGVYKLKHGSLKSFSEQQLVDCSTSEGNHGCSGGLPSKAFTYVESKPIEQESDYSYSGKDGSCHYSKSKGVTTIKNYSRVSSSDKQILSALSGRPLSVGLDATPLQHYSSGIVDGGCSTHHNHATLMVGYKSSENAWKVKNSWGSGWGENGYFRIKAGANTCGIQTQVAYPSL